MPVNEPDEDNCIEFGFNLSGSYAGKHRGQNFLQQGNLAEGTTKTLGQERLLKVDIHLDSPDRLRNLVPGDLAQFSKDVQRLLEGSREFYYNIQTITPAMRLSLEQLLNCPFQGLTRQIYLEGKCLELIALKLEQLMQGEQQPDKTNELKLDDVDRVHQAKEILIARLNNPPSLLELARQVGLNDFKLKRGFRQVFGTSTFDYLYRCRMEHARQLLAEGNLRVKEVSRAVGYANQSHFAAAFRRQFGVNPKSYTGKKSG